MNTNDIQQVIKAMLEAQVIQALKSTPEALELMVKSAIEIAVDERTGNPTTTSSYNKIPYLQYATSTVIRETVRSIAQRLIKEQEPAIEAKLREYITAEKIAEGWSKAITQAADEDWRVKVVFGKEEN